MNATQINLASLRRAVANYMQTEGCSCCEGFDHKEHKKILAKLLEVPQYQDKSGYNFERYADK